jgi:hypothetical protein
MANGPEWFAPKRYGYGTGLPISWQGWAVMISFVVLVIGIGLLFKDRPAALIAAIIPPTVALIIICARTTRGGWRWRWGSDD